MESGLVRGLRDQIVDLIDAHAVFSAPIPPLRAVNTAEISFFIRPLVPNRDAVFVEIFDVRVAAQKPKQLVNDRFDVELLRREQRKSRTARPQIESCLRAEDRQRPRAGSIGARLTFFQNQPEEIVILPHAKRVRMLTAFAKSLL